MKSTCFKVLLAVFVALTVLPSASIADTKGGIEARLGVPLENYDPDVATILGGVRPKVPLHVGLSYFFSGEAGFGVSLDALTSITSLSGTRPSSEHLRVAGIFRQQIGNSFSLQAGVGADLFSFGTGPGNEHYRLGLAVEASAIYKPSRIGLGAGFVRGQYLNYMSDHMSIFLLFSR